jgi:hypothetical protein
MLTACLHPANPKASTTTSSELRPVNNFSLVLFPENAWRDADVRAALQSIFGRRISVQHEVLQPTLKRFAQLNHNY